MNICAIVLDYRRADLTARCLDSLAGQVERAIVVDNGADERASARLREHLAQHGKAPPVTVLDPGRNLGFAAGVNHALRSLAPGAGDAVLLLNNDAVLERSAVARLAAALQAHDGRAVVAPERTDQGAPLRLWYQPWLGLVTQQPLWGGFSFLSGACLLVPGSLAAAGLFDEEFFMYGEDIELAWRLQRAGIAQVTAEGVGISHHGSVTSRPGNFFYEYHSARAHLTLARKLARNPAHRWLLLAGRAAALPARASLRAIRHRSPAPLEALLRAATAKAGRYATAP